MAVKELNADKESILWYNHTLSWPATFENLYWREDHLLSHFSSCLLHVVSLQQRSHFVLQSLISICCIYKNYFVMTSANSPSKEGSIF